MKSTDDQGLIPVIVASEADTTYIRTIPTAQATSGDGSVSLDLGLPPECAIAVAAGGKRPEMKDMNGIWNLFSRAIQSLQAYRGVYDATFATAIGGYPKYAMVSDSSGNFWVSTADSNTTVPGADEADWQSLFTGLQTALGFTPVQQGGGSYQDATQKVYLGAYTRFGTTPGLQIGDTDYGVLVSGTLYSATNSGDLPIYSFHCTSAGIPGCWYGPSTDDTTWLLLARQSDVTDEATARETADTTIQDNLTTAVANQSTINAGFSADISDCVSGVDGIDASAGDKQGTALYFAGAIAKPFFQYSGGNGALAWSNDVTAVNTSLTTAVANQSNVNAGFSADISDCVSGTVGMSQSEDMQMRGLCMRYSAYNGDGLYPYATYNDSSGDATNVPLVQSVAGSGFSVIYNAKMQYVSASEGYLWVDYVGGGSAKFTSSDCGEIAASGNITSGYWTKTGNILRQVIFLEKLSENPTVTFPTAYSAVPCVTFGTSTEYTTLNTAFANIQRDSDGNLLLSTTGCTLHISRGAPDVDPSADGVDVWMAVEGPVSS